MVFWLPTELANFTYIGFRYLCLLCFLFKSCFHPLQTNFCWNCYSHWLLVVIWKLFCFLSLSIWKEMVWWELPLKFYFKKANYVMGKTWWLTYRVDAYTLVGHDQNVCICISLCWWCPNVMMSEWYLKNILKCVGVFNRFTILSPSIVFIEAHHCQICWSIQVNMLCSPFQS